MVTIANLVLDTLGEKNVVLSPYQNVVLNTVPYKRNEDVTVTRTNEDQWTFTWTSTYSPFTLVLDGEVIATTIDNSYVIVSETEPSLEVYASFINDEPYTVENKPYGTLQWFSETGLNYDLYRYVSPSFRRSGQQTGAEGITHYERATGFIGDDSQEVWKITAYNEYNTAGDSVEYPFPIVSHPVAPEYSASIVAGSLTISEA